MSDKLDLKKHIRNVEDFPIPGIKFRDITSLIETPEPFRKTCKELTTENEYFKMFYSLDLNIIERSVIDYPVEDLFIKNSDINEKIKQTLNKEMLFTEELAFEYIDYLLA